MSSAFPAWPTSPRSYGRWSRRARTYHTRTHVDVDPDNGLDGLHAVRQAAADLGEPLNVEIVAFPQACTTMGPLGVWVLELILDRTSALGMPGRITLSHGFFLTDESVPAATRDRLVSARGPAWWPSRRGRWRRRS